MGGEHSRKEPFEQLVNSYSEHLHMSAQSVENARDKTIVVTCQLLVAVAQEADFVVDLEMEAAGMPGVGSRELLLHNQEASIRERMRHEIH